jgi:hypothetical protein
MLTVFYNALIHVCILTALFLVNNRNNGSLVLSSRYVLKDVIGDFLEQYDIVYISQQQTAAQSSSNRRKKIIDYN